MLEIKWKPWTLDERKKQLANGPNLITTFRSGPKWFKPELVNERVSFVGTDDGVKFAEGTIISVKYVLFRDIDEQDHSRQSSDMTPENRLKVMQSVYDGFTEDTLTTVVTIGDIMIGGL